MARTSPPAPQLVPVIYTQPGCRFCGAAKAWLTERGIPFRERDIQADPTAWDEAEALAINATPAIVIEGQVILGFDAPAIEAALTQEARPAREAREAGSTDQGP